MKSLSNRLAALEQLEAAQRPAAPAFACIHAADYAVLSDPATLAEVSAAITQAYQLRREQKLYIGVCLCDPPESCRVCGEYPFLSPA